MLDKTRLYATLIIWIAFTFILTLLSWYVFTFDDLAGPPAVFVAALMVTIALAATVNTRAIWHRAPPYQADHRQVATPGRAAQRKTKRANDDRIERLIAELDDDDIYDLEALLLARDDERKLTANQQP
jgi:hypothetical protein